jgi:hypothetical protein
VDGKHVLVIGSQTPWIETILLNKGAKHITTFDYVKIKSEHPQVEVITPEELSDKFLKKIRYDVIISFSSVEHSGLGRYFESYFVLICVVCCNICCSFYIYSLVFWNIRPDVTTKIIFC